MAQAYHTACACVWRLPAWQLMKRAVALIHSRPRWILEKVMLYGNSYFDEDAMYGLLQCPSAWDACPSYRFTPTPPIPGARLLPARGRDTPVSANGNLSGNPCSYGRHWGDELLRWGILNFQYELQKYITSIIIVEILSIHSYYVIKYFLINM